MDIKKTITTKMDIKKCHYEDGVLIDENGEEVDVNEKLFKLFGSADSFNVSATLKEENEILEEDLEV